MEENATKTNKRISPTRSIIIILVFFAVFFLMALFFGLARKSGSDAGIIMIGFFFCVFAALTAVLLIMLFFALRNQSMAKAEHDYEMKELSEEKSREDDILLQNQLAIGNMRQFIWEMDLSTGDAVLFETDYTRRRCIEHKLPTDRTKIFSFIVERADEQSKKTIASSIELLRKGREVNDVIRYTPEADIPDRILRLHMTPIISKDGSIERAIGTTRDITEESFRSGEFQRGLSFFRSLRDPKLYLAARINLTKNFLVESRPDMPSFRETLTYDEITRTGPGFLGELEDGRRISAILERNALIKSFTDGDRKNTFVIKQRINGNIVWAKITTDLLENPETGDIEMFFYSTDVTETEIERRILSLLNQGIYEVVSVINPYNSSIRFVGRTPSDAGSNDGKMIDYSAAFLHSVEKYVCEEDRERIISQFKLPKIKYYLKEKGNYSTTIQWTGNDGQKVWKLVQFNYLSNSKDMILVLVSDVTEHHEKEQSMIYELRSALEKAKSADVAKSQFLSRISHDIRTPIGAILNLTDFATQDIGSKERLLDDLSKIKTSGTFLLSLINDVLDISKIDSGVIELHEETYSLEHYLTNIENIINPMSSDRSVFTNIRTDFGDIRAIVTDSVRLNQITLNLLSNAMKYTPSGGRVSFFAKTSPLPEGSKVFGKEELDTLLAFDVEDTGIGMSEKFQRHMFDEFSQEDSNPLRSSKIAGTGLGLAIVKKLIDLMGGTITVKSALEKGTSIHVELPVKAASDDLKEDETTVESAEPISGQILLAEDNEINAMIADRIFKDIGVSMDRASDGAKALELYTGHSEDYYDVIFMDIQMPEMDGYQATQAIRSAGRADSKKIPIIAMTADAFTDAMKKALDAGMNDYTTKPLDIKKIRALLLKYIQKK
ncbi:MAG: response regulator [Lachnospiraceae bacterium]|nr:response regulator [Lachnospiraceae bacterium]